MLKIEESLGRYTQMLERNAPTAGYKAGCWQRQELDKRLVSVGRSFCSMLDDLRKIPARFGLDGAAMASQGKYYKALFKAAGAVKQILAVSDSATVQTELNNLAQRVAGLKYYLEAANGGLDKAPLDPKLYATVLAVAGKWKQAQQLYPAGGKLLTKRDDENMRQVCAYPEFVEVLLKDKKLQDNFFKWSIRDNNGVSQFVEFPAASARIAAANLAKRVGRFSAGLFAIQKQKIDSSESKISEKVICLPFNTSSKVEYISLLDEDKKVVLNGGLELTIRKIIDLFAKKNAEFTDLEFFASTGITNWNTMELGPRDAKTNAYAHADLTAADWWKNLPALEEISQAEVEARYGEKPADGEWLVCVKSGRQTLDQDFEQRHSYLEIAIPSTKGNYGIYPFGHYPLRFPRSPFEAIKFLAKVTLGRINYPDNNTFFSMRQHAVHAIKLAPQQSAKLMQVIQQDLIKGLQGNFTFQFKDENCAQWTQSTIHSFQQEPKHNFFKMKVLDAYPLNPVMGKLFALMRKASPDKQGWLVRGVLRLLGGKKGITIIEDGKSVYKNVLDHPNAQGEVQIYQPGLMHPQIEGGQLNGHLRYGH